MGGAKAHYDGIVAFSQTDFTEDLKKITVPVLVMHSEDDQIVPYVAAGPKSAELLRNGTLKTYKDFPHGMPTTAGGHDQRRPAGLLAVLRSGNPPRTYSSFPGLSLLVAMKMNGPDIAAPPFFLHRKPASLPVGPEALPSYRKPVLAFASKRSSG